MSTATDRDCPWGSPRCYWLAGNGRAMALPADVAGRWSADGRRVVFGTYAEAASAGAVRPPAAGVPAGAPQLALFGEAA